MRSLAAALGAGLLLGACGGGGVSSDDVRDPVAQNVAEAAAKGKSAAVAAAIDCSNKPDFVPVYHDARITTCVASEDGRGQRHVSGSIVYLTEASPREVLGWSRAQANASGLAQRLATDKSYSAGEESQRSLMVVVEPVAQGTRVTVNWGDRV
ncbi:MAG: hypothetical protein J7500_04680 [Sphingomonas sp.]|uniref:hypothetical protein n=1 Tax=Sphingomonas sp. TaxID=28214 RepID=UPI001B28919C|nr:hypothetical protein [Sphingomonas sp.]MBO9621988.1 hypothetical protein [Sphingomonas sp.]